MAGVAEVTAEAGKAAGMRRSHLLVIAGLALAALIMPLPLYFIALACFGLPHVLWELAYLQRVCRGVPFWWWAGLFLLLLIQAGARLLLWRGQLDPWLGIRVDVLSLVLALLLVWTLPGFGRGGTAQAARSVQHARLAALAAALLLTAAGSLQNPVWAMALLILLSVIHNFTPIALARLGTPDGVSRLPWLDRVFWLPLLLLPVAAWGGMRLPGLPLSAWQPVEILWLRDGLLGTGGHATAWGEALLSGLLSALVLAQCLHYYSVLRLLPASLGGQMRSGGWIVPAVALSLALTYRFAVDFPEARKLYAVAAGFHAWLEWPVLLLGLAGWWQTPPMAQTKQFFNLETSGTSGRGAGE